MAFGWSFSAKTRRVPRYRLCSAVPTTFDVKSALEEWSGLVHEYARTHGITARVWGSSQGEDGWELVVSTIPPGEGTEPGPRAVSIELHSGDRACVEVEGSTGEMCSSMAGFLADLLGKTVKAGAESRFFGRELAERYEEITLLYTISEILGSVITLEGAARTILQEVTDTMGVERAALWVHEPEAEELRLIAAVGGEPPSGPIRVHDDVSITAVVFRERRPMILEADDVFPRLGQFGSPTNRDSFLAVPVTYTPPRGEPRTIGVIHLIGRRLDEGFSAGDQKLITAIASQIGAAIENSRLVAQSVSQERLEREMELAHDLQLKLLPSVEQFRDRAEVAARCLPAESVGGDFYHLFRLPGDQLGVVIGDVSSHGFAAALIMALTMSAVTIHASEGDPPAEVLRNVHRSLRGELETTEMYMTLFYGVMDPAQGRLIYANAGHPHAFLVPRTGEPRRLSVTNPPLGFVDPDSYYEAAVPLTTGEDLLFLFTDGLADLLGTGSGEACILDKVLEFRHQPLATIMDELFELEGAPSEVPSDDRTAILVRV